jgi:hypothetical protein
MVIRPDQIGSGIPGLDRKNRLTSDLKPPRRQPAQPEVTIADEDRCAQVDLFLHDHMIRLYTRIGGLITVLFAQPRGSLRCAPTRSSLATPGT